MASSFCLTAAQLQSLVQQILANQGWLGLWGLNRWLLAQAAACSQPFANALVTAVVVEG